MNETILKEFNIDLDIEPTDFEFKVWSKGEDLTYIDADGKVNFFRTFRHAGERVYINSFYEESSDKQKKLETWERLEKILVNYFYENEYYDRLHSTVQETPYIDLVIEENDPHLKNLEKFVDKINKYKEFYRLVKE